jgi:glycine/D-amino acid oxidase-like deaminating enzyme
MHSMPIFIDYHSDHPFYGLPIIEIPGVKIGWHHTGPEIDPDQRRPQNERSLAVTGDYVRERFPHLDPRPIKVITCLYTNTPDYHFILDHHPGLPNVVVGAGFSGHGFKFGPVVGRILADLALGERPPLPLEQFAISRLAMPEKLQPRSGA